MGFGQFAKNRHQSAAIIGSAGHYDVAGLDTLQRDCDDVGPQAVEVKAGCDGHRLPGGNDFELVFQRLDKRTIWCAAPIGARIDAPECTPGRIGATHPWDGFVGDVLEGDRTPARQAMFGRHRQHPRLVIEDRHVQPVRRKRQPRHHRVDSMVK